jgi:hypothetical protein
MSNFKNEDIKKFRKTEEVYHDYKLNMSKKSI